MWVQSLGAVNKANSKELKPLMARLDTVLRSMLADFGKDKAGVLACKRMSLRTLHLATALWNTPSRMQVPFPLPEKG